MKFRNLLTAVVLFFAACTSFAQSKITEPPVQLNPSNPALVQQVTYTIPSGFTYSGTNPECSIATSNIGMSSDNVDLQVKKNSNGHDTTISVARKVIYRTIYTFYLNDIKYTPTNHISITNVKLHYGTASSGYTFKITQPSSNPATPPEKWSTAGNSSSKQTGIPYSGYLVDPASGLSSAISSSLPAGVLYLGVVSESESSSGSVATFTGFYLEVTYQRDNEARTVIARNDMDGFNGGQIYWDQGLVTSPQQQTLHEAETHTFGVYSPQTYNSYQYIWNTGGTNTSQWYKTVNNGQLINLGANTSVSYTTSWSELGTIDFTAYMKKVNTVNLYEATEFNGTIGPITLGTVITSVPFSAQAPSSLTVGSNTYQFAGWSDGVGQNPRSITTSQNVDLTALYKVVHKSNDASAFSNNGERKAIRTYEGWYHMVYTSMGRVWLEESSDGGATWFLGNSGMSLDNGGGSSPSIDQFALPSDGHSIIIVAFQEGSNIHVRSFNWDTYGRNFYIDGPQELFPCSGNSPAVAWSTGGLFMVVWKASSGIAYMPCYLSGYTIGYDQAHQGIISGTNQNSSNPVISSDPYSGGQYFDVAWQQLQPPPPGPPLISIKSCMLYPTSGGYGSSIGQYPASPLTVSSSSMTQNTCESIISLPDGPRICWIADYSGTYGGQPTQMKTAMTNPWSSPQTYYTYSFCSRTTSINKRDDDGRFYFAWNQAIPPPIDPQWTYTNYAVGSANLSQTKVIGIGSRWDVQLCNGSSSSNIFVTGFNTTVSPYAFQQSENLAADGLAKTSPVSVANRRGVTIENDGAGIYYSFGDVTVDGKPVSFVQMKGNPGGVKLDGPSRMNWIKNKTGRDSISVDSVNTLLETEPFELKGDSTILFSDYIAIGDSSAAVSLLGDKGYVSFEIDVVDAATGKLIGTVKKTTFDHNGLRAQDVSQYRLLSSGLKGRTVKMKMTLATNIGRHQLSITDEYTNASDRGLNRSSLQSLALQGVDLITDYVLSQNYPNPFNPTTVISYTIPKESRVTLKIYDVLGQEVRTLVNEDQQVGRYSVNFNGSGLSSGIYFYRLVAGNHVITKKMLLIK